MSKRISFLATDTSLVSINNTMDKYKYTQTEALNYICTCHDRQDKNLNDWYRVLLFNFMCNMTNAVNVARTSGDVALIEKCMEEFKCQIL